MVLEEKERRIIRVEGDDRNLKSGSEEVHSIKPCKRYGFGCLLSPVAHLVK
jgi:hypothetical protein